MEETMWSNCKFIGLYKFPKSNQHHKLILTLEPKITDSINEFKHNIKVIKIIKQGKILTPSYPNLLPQNPDNKELNKGKNKIKVYI